MNDSEIKSYKDLIIWQKSFELVKLIYKKTSNLPKEEVFALQLQIRRASISVVSSIAEGYNRKTKKDYRHFLSISYGSISELETQLLLCRDIYGLNVEEELNLITEVSKMLRSIINKLNPNP